ncbi:hypothetical protein BDP27DRAFT_1427519 [Rhodocollybia butyracea]|uniref:Uncharacterized protein n=1 Tax=Rhodocollybia butyracea TaxID=206335 RepID=A0A9P5PG94_9AGAR|nr:hypothetical protein BDP27DRAFT_1427519 [Rhodocollybia butyracea]
MDRLICEEGEEGVLASSQNNQPRTWGFIDEDRHRSMRAPSDDLRTLEFPTEVLKSGLQVGEMSETPIQKLNEETLEISDEMKERFKTVIKKRGTKEERRYLNMRYSHLVRIQNILAYLFTNTYNQKIRVQETINISDEQYATLSSWYNAGTQSETEQKSLHAIERRVTRRLKVLSDTEESLRHKEESLCLREELLRRSTPASTDTDPEEYPDTRMEDIGRSFALSVEDSASHHSQFFSETNPPGEFPTWPSQDQLNHYVALPPLSFDFEEYVWPLSPAGPSVAATAAKRPTKLREKNIWKRMSPNLTTFFFDFDFGASGAAEEFSSSETSASPVSSVKLSMSSSESESARLETHQFSSQRDLRASSMEDSSSEKIMVDLRVAAHRIWRHQSRSTDELLSSLPGTRNP